MKRMIAYLAVLVMLLSACSGEPTPNKYYSEGTVAAMQAAIETLDDFLSYKLTAEEAREKLDRIADTMDTSDTFSSSASTLIFCASLDVSRCGRYSDFGANSEAADAMADVRESRDKLYDTLYSK